MWLTGPAASWHVGSSQTRARTRVPCISRQILNHCATREAPLRVFLKMRNQVHHLRKTTMVPAPGSAGVCPMLPTLGLMGPALTCATGEDPEGLVGSSPAPAQTKLSSSEVPGASLLRGPWGQPPGTRGLYQDNSPRARVQTATTCPPTPGRHL